MPTRISTKDKQSEIAWLCEDEWELAAQVYQLEKWLTTNSDSLDKAEYIADIGYIGKVNASGGGCVMSLEFMRILTSLGMEVWFSEYPSPDK